MKFTKQYRVEIYNEYMSWVDQVSEDLEDKTYFYPEEIVNKVLDIVETIEQRGVEK